MIRLLYSAAGWLATPIVVARLLWRSRRQPGYAEHIGERFGRYGAIERAPRIWVHAVSVGETRAAAPIVAALRARWPAHRILLTHMTATGRATGAEVYGGRVEQAWLPYDHGFAVRGFLRAFRPDLGILLETEIWPRLVAECAVAGMPLVLANARLSERSARGYARFPRFTRETLRGLRGIAAQTEADARRFRELGAERVAVTGNVKFDVAIPEGTMQRGEAMRVLLGASRVVWIAGSTREGEEALLLDAFAAIDDRRVLLVIVPRHPERFDAVAALARERGYQVVRRSEGIAVDAAVRVAIGDSMGEMLAYYAAADVVVMGGSLLAYGSQNLIEPCALGKPVIVGPSSFNFEEAADGAIAAGAALRVPDAPAAMAAALAISHDAPRREAMGEAARAFVAAHRGAVARLVAWLEPLLPTAAPAAEAAAGAASARERD
ncbi:MAG TPA: lipid IV(A) 3-deoxy-D-manno-octulosonic acid transferase [Usitatibacter sp.]|nr:lipid IV(A) 3-deoxy-D-manno-octulosonic acid transferase [Usitatibacter sp.]